MATTHCDVLFPNHPSYVSLRRTHLVHPDGVHAEWFAPLAFLYLKARSGCKQRQKRQANKPTHTHKWRPVSRPQQANRHFLGCPPNLWTRRCMRTAVHVGAKEGGQPGCSDLSHYSLPTAKHGGGGDSPNTNRYDTVRIPWEEREARHQRSTY